MDGLTSQVAIEEFLKQGVAHSRKVWRRAWPLGNLLVEKDGSVARMDREGILTELTEEDLNAIDWTLDEHEFL